MTAGFLLALKLLDLMAMGVQNWSAAQPAIDNLRAKMKVFATEGREPTLAEWDEINAETDGLIDEAMKDPL